MNKFEAMKELPVERFADFFFDMVMKAGNKEAFKEMLLQEFPNNLKPVLQKCSTGEDLTFM